MFRFPFNNNLFTFLNPPIATEHTIPFPFSAKNVSIFPKIIQLEKKKEKIIMYQLENVFD